MTLPELRTFLEGKGEKPFRGEQLFRWIHGRCAVTYAEMTDLSKEFRASLQRGQPLRQPVISEEAVASDGTRKMRYLLADGLEVEGVYMPETERRTLCVSTQVGCGMGCAFCATGTMGLARNLSAGEIVGQVETVVRGMREGGLERPVSNVVFMGMGEPLANLDAVVAAVEILLEPKGLGLSRRHITVSTCGLVNAMPEFVQRCPAKLAISLNATTDDCRDRLMPVNKRFPLRELLDCCRNLPLGHTDRITFEYVLIGGVNDSMDDARRLVDWMRGVRCKINLIPLNPYPESPFQRPAEARVSEFQEYLIARALSVFVRKSRGDSLQGACGQLVVRPLLGGGPPGPERKQGE